jgi:two-component system response regulator YesN
LAVIRRIFGENLGHTRLDPPTARCLFYDLLSTLLKTAGNLGFSRNKLINMQKVEQLGNLYEMRDYIEEAVENICKAVNVKRMKKAPGLEKQIYDYIEQNLYQPELSLISIADHFDVSVSYVSMTFKNLTGVPYSEYINKARIKKAVSLLETQDLSTEDVVRMTGYVSLSTFRRNFIKYTNQRPGAMSRRTVPPENSEKQK